MNALSERKAFGQRGDYRHFLPVLTRDLFCLRGDYDWVYGRLIPPNPIPRSCCVPNA